MPTGTVKFFNETRGFGFIVPDEGGPDMFVHVSAIAHGMPELTEGMRVVFDVTTDRRNGKTKAENVRSAGNDRR
jgi:CspA family cold shock protein